MKWVLFFVFGLTANKIFSQPYIIDTLKNASTSINTYNTLPFYGFTTSGHIYGVGFNNIFDNNNKSLPIEFVRIDFENKNVQYKNLASVLSGNAACWNYVFDNTGNIYLSMNVPVRKIVKMNLKDSIKYEDLGNAFGDNHSLAYSASLGRDGKLYFGGSSGDTYWSSYDPKSKLFEKHQPIDLQNDYVLSIAGDSDYVYAQTGQRNSVQLWSVRKKDDQKKLLCRIPNTTRISLEIHHDGIYASFFSDTLKGVFKLVKGDTVRIATMPLPLNRINYTEVNDTQKPSIISVFDPVQSKVYFSINNKPFDSLNITSRYIGTAISKIFSFKNDGQNIYYTGELYGNYYRYDLKNNLSYLLGATGYNIYSTLSLNDSIIYFGGYPSGYIMKWDRKQPWTTKKFINGKLVEASDANANPKILKFWKSQGTPAAGFHHTLQMVFDDNENIVGAGNVIRIGNGASIGVYNPTKDNVYGINYAAYTGLEYRSICKWKKLIVYAMGTYSDKKSKLYFYDPSANKMTDSLDLGFDDYGKIFLSGNTLIGIARNRVYKLDLSTKKLITTYSFAKNSIADAFMLSNGKIIINTANKIPEDFWPVVNLHYSNYCEAAGNVYATDGKYLIHIHGLIN